MRCSHFGENPAKFGIAAGGDDDALARPSGDGGAFEQEILAIHQRCVLC